MREHRSEQAPSPLQITSASVACRCSTGRYCTTSIAADAAVATNAAAHHGQRAISTTRAPNGTKSSTLSRYP